MKFICKSALLSAVCILLLFYKGYCQRYSNDVLARNSFYVEAATQASPYTVNFDRIFHSGDKVSYTYRVGFSYDAKSVSLPLALGLLTGRESHHFEFSTMMIPYLNLHDTKDDPRDLYLYFIPAAGYRYQKREGGLFFKVMAGPAIFCNPPSDNFWKMDPKVYAYGSIALGVSF